MFSLRGIVGSTGFSLALAVTNRGDQPLVLEEAVLLAEDEKPYQADFPGQGELKWRTVGAKQSGWVDISWEFDKQAIEVLGECAQLTLRFLHGEETSGLEADLSDCAGARLGLHVLSSQRQPGSGNIVENLLCTAC